jgi:hypothetical protein
MADFEDLLDAELLRHVSFEMELQQIIQVVVRTLGGGLPNELAQMRTLISSGAGSARQGSRAGG